MRANELWAINFSLIDGKHGWTRGNVLGGNMNYTLRAVIILDPTLKLDEVDISYKGFLIAYSSHIVKKLRQKHGWTITRSLNYLRSIFRFDQEIFDIMMESVTENRMEIILNRNPTICFGSILLMKIRKVKKDPDDQTLSIPSSILPGLNADLIFPRRGQHVNINLFNCRKAA